MDFATSCISNLNAHYDTLLDTDIKFLYFMADDLAKGIFKPKMRQVFKKWRTDDETFYLIHGINGRNSWNAHVYRETILKHFVRIVDSVSSPAGTAPLIYDVELLQDDAGDVNHGDHITFGITRQRAAGTALLLTHRTSYIDDAGDFNFRRETCECNFVLTQDTAASVVESKRSFLDTKCGRTPGTMDTMGSVYVTVDSTVIHALATTAVLGHPMTGGGGRSHCAETRRYYTYKGRRRLIRRGDNCRYIDCGNGRRKVVQRGGAYHGVTFMSDAFVTFLAEKLFKEVQRTQPWLESVRLMYDELDELGEGSNRYIVVAYEFDVKRNVFFIAAHDALVACYVENLPTSAASAVTPEERHVHGRFMASAAAMVRAIAT